MKKWQKKLGQLAQRVIDRAMGNGLMQEEMTAEGEQYQTPGIARLIRQAGAEGCVLLKNNGALPLDTGKETAVFGRCQLDWFYVGYGSGGDVNAPYHVNLIEGLQNAGVPLNPDVLNAYEEWRKEENNKADHGWWGHWPTHHPEMPLDMALVKKAAETADTALQDEARLFYVAITRPKKKLYILHDDYPSDYLGVLRDTGFVSFDSHSLIL